jgi:hypothetical protein
VTSYLIGDASGETVLTGEDSEVPVATDKAHDFPLVLEAKGPKDITGDDVGEKDWHF